MSRLFENDSVDELLETLRQDMECYADPDWYDEDGDGAECSLLVIEELQIRFNELTRK